MSDVKLRSSLIRLAHAKPELRGVLLPLLKKAAVLHKDDVEGIRKSFEEMTLSERTKGKSFLQKAAKELAKLTGYPFVYKEDGISGGKFGVGPRWAAYVISGRVALRMEIASPIVRVDGGYTQPSGVTVGPSYSKLGFVGSSGSLDYEGDLKGPPTLRTLKGLIEKIGGVEKLIHMLGGPLQGRHSGPVTIPLIKDFIQRQRTYFDLEDESPTSLSYGTRENGGDERPGEADIQAASAMVKALRTEFGKAIQVKFSTVDEWVSFSVTLTS